ncbi:response regulator transcription factor [Bowdeniella massiliensis]|uniref:response regulator transcription factor n=1 Tax=Bowdeniella massiliensis TaxID=2932264 RepID=UPI0032B15919
MTAEEFDAENDSVIRVLIVDDQALLRMGFAMVLDGADGIEVIGEAADGRAAISQAKALYPDVVLMDVRMPEVDGIEATKQIVAALPHTRVLVLTTFDLDEYAFAGLRAGASGFLLKDTPPADLITAIRNVASGEAVLSPRITSRMLELFGEKLPTEEAADSAHSAAINSLTVREREVLELIATGASNAEIASELFVSETTIKTHVGNLLAKLGLRDRVQAVVFAYENGIVTPH